MNIKQKCCGYITIVGKTNVGKSTLINQIIGQKISIVSKKKNTTQNNITAVKTQKHNQSIYIDTPGVIFNIKKNEITHKENNFFRILKNSTLIMLVVDRVFWTQKDDLIFNKIIKNKIPIVVVINKIDKISNKNLLLPFINFLKKKNEIIEIFPICAKKKQNITLLCDQIKSYLPKNPHLYPENYITTNTLIFTTSEIIREQLILFLGDELPSIIKVKIESFQKTKKKELSVRAIVLVENIRQKKIIIGRNGDKIKKISIISRNQVEKKFLMKTHLFLWVKSVS